MTEGSRNDESLPPSPPSPSSPRRRGSMPPYPFVIPAPETSHPRPEPCHPRAGGNPSAALLPPPSGVKKLPAVDRQFDTGDVVGAVRAQKHHRACNFFRRAQASSLDSSGPEKPMPAAATSMSMRPACAACATARATLSRSLSQSAVQSPGHRVRAWWPGSRSQAEYRRTPRARHARPAPAQRPHRCRWRPL